MNKIQIQMANIIEHCINPNWTGRIYMSLPGKGLKGHICPTIVMPWYHKLLKYGE